MLYSTHDAATCINPKQDRTSKFVEQNAPQTYNALNIYDGLLQDIGIPYGLRLEVKHVILTKGLATYVEECDAISDGLLEGLGVLSLAGNGRDAYRWLEYAQVNRYTTSIGRVLDFICTTVAQTDEEVVRLILQVLLFFSRFTLCADDQAQAVAFDKFRRVNRRCRDIDNLNYPWPSHLLRGMLREELSVIFTPTDWHFDLIRDAHFSSGSTLDGRGRTLIGKLKALSQYRPNLYNNPAYPLSDQSGLSRRLSVPRLIAVPKGFSSRRVIAPEETYLAYSAQAALEALRRMLAANGTANFINERDQMVNQSLAAAGSRDGSWATIDMSSASDSIARRLFFECVPTPFHDMYANYMSWYVDIPQNKGKERVPLHSLFTSGNPLTWLTEACWFTGLGRVGVRLEGVDGYRHKVFAYGDDLIVPSCAYDTVCSVLEMFGHTVNRRKSYGTGVFRESCGGWYYHGCDVTPTYWPRREVRNNLPDLVSSLCSLQHNLYSAGYFVAADTCAEIARDLYPTMTSSPVGSTNEDLWDKEVTEYDEDSYKHVYFPVKWEVNEKDLKDPELRRMYDMYVYTEYLKEGPFFESEMDRMLGTSTRRYQPRKAYGKPSLRIARR